MNVGVWMVPVVLVGLFVILWSATWLERLIAPPNLEPELAVPEVVVDSAFTDTVGRPGSFVADGQLAAERP